MQAVPHGTLLTVCQHAGHASGSDSMLPELLRSADDPLLRLVCEYADYPFKAPSVRFETACFHPNVDQHGNICLDILKEKWSAAYSVRTVLLSIQSLLGEPNNDSPLNAYAAKVCSRLLAPQPPQSSIPRRQIVRA